MHAASELWLALIEFQQRHRCEDRHLAEMGECGELLDVCLAEAGVARYVDIDGWLSRPQGGL